ncbi:MAG: DUF2169 domain-containing protein [Rhizobacter sp.]
MELINATRMTVGCNMALEPSGRELLVVVIKGTFVLPKPGEPVRLHEEQLPLVMADTFTGEPGFSAPIHEIDFAPHKPACDVLLVGHARAPEGHQVTRLRAGLRVGPMEKAFDVVGDRRWQAGLTSITASAPQAFAEKLVSYDTAFGGADRNSADENEHDAYLSNPVGRGWHKHLKNAWVDGQPLPNTEEVGKSVAFPSDKYKPMALSPLSRGWPQRARYAGTYDQQWLDDIFPFLPKDFDERYYQAAPEDQQVPLPTGPMEVVLSGFTVDGRRQFMLPHFEAPVHVFPKRGEREDCTATLDTIAFDPDAERFTMSWRVARPLKKNMHEIAQVLVGRKGKEWWQQREQIAFPIPVVMVPWLPKKAEMP